jgi:hypothetical protein
MIAFFRTVNAILGQVRRASSVGKSDLKSGDEVLVTTENSVYSIRVHEDATYSVRGGWFDRQGLSPVRISISGCTWGGSVIRTNVVAACGLHLEFGNRVLTTRIREVRVIREEAGGRRRLRRVESRELLRACYGSRPEVSNS